MKYIQEIFEKYQALFHIVMLEDLHRISNTIPNSLGFIHTESLTKSLDDFDEFSNVPSFGICYGTQLAASVDEVDKYKKDKKWKELICLTLYKNQPIVETSMVEDLLKPSKSKEVKLIAKAEPIKIEIEEKTKYYRVYFNPGKVGKEKLLVTFIEGTDQVYN